jgi:tetratricopeptide (TPR) repeat protein
MSLPVTGKRTSENPDPSTQPYKVARTGTEGFHSSGPNQINGHLYTPLPSFQATFNGVFSASSAPLHTPTPEEFYALQGRVIQLEHQVSSLEMKLDRSSNSEARPLLPPDKETMFSQLATVSSKQQQIATKPTAFAAFSHQPPTIPPPKPRIVSSPTQHVMPTAFTPVSSSQAQIVIPPTQPVMTTANDPSLLPPQETDFEKGNEFFAQKEYKKAIEHYFKALETKSSKSSVFFNLGQCYRNTKEIPKAIDFYSRILMSENLYIPARIKIALCYFEQEEYKQAIEILSKIHVPESDKKYDHFHALFGDCHNLLQNSSKAIEHYKKVSQNHTSFGNIQYCLGYYHLNEPQTGIGFFKDAIIFAGSDQRIVGCAHFWLGTIYLGQKDYAKARTHFTLVPKDHGQFDEAQEHLKTLQTQNQSNSD